MALFGLVFVIVALILIGVGIAIGLVGLAIAAVLVGLGIVSSSVAVGVRSGRAEVGLRAFAIQCGLAAGTPAGAVCAYLVHGLFQEYDGGWPVLVYGAIGGAFAGVLIALLFEFVSRHAAVWLFVHLPARFRERRAMLKSASAESGEPVIPRRRRGLLR